EELDRHRAIELGVVGGIDRSHASRAQQLAQLEAAEVHRLVASTEQALLESLTADSQLYPARVEHREQSTPALRSAAWERRLAPRRLEAPPAGLELEARRSRSLGRGPASGCRSRPWSPARRASTSRAMPGRGDPAAGARPGPGRGRASAPRREQAPACGGE